MGWNGGYSGRQAGKVVLDGSGTKVPQDAGLR